MGDRGQPQTVRRGLFALAGSLALGLTLARCGAEGTPAPDLAPEDRPQPSSCKTVHELMPNFFALLADPTAPLKDLGTAVGRLSEGQSAGDNPVGSVLGNAVRGLKQFTKDVDESSDAKCLPKPPRAPLCTIEAGAGTACENRICAMRRTLDFGVRDHEAVDALHDLQPILVKVVGYLSNHGKGADGTEHLEGVAVLHRTSSAENESRCAPQNLLEVLDGTVVYFRASPECGHDCMGDKALRAVKALINDPALQSFLASFEGAQHDGAGRDGFQKLAKVLGEGFAATPEDEHYFDQIQLLVDQVTGFLDKDPDKYGRLRKEVDDLAALIKGLMDPKRPGAILHPLKAVVDCVNHVDDKQELVGALYDLLSRQGGVGGEGLDLKEVVDGLDGLAQVDRDGVLLGFFHVVLKSTREDEQAMDNLRALLADVLTVENARAVLPALQTMIERGVIDEVAGLFDNLLYGCKTDASP